MNIPSQTVTEHDFNLLLSCVILGKSESADQTISNDLKIEEIDNKSTRNSFQFDKEIDQPKCINQKLLTNWFHASKMQMNAQQQMIKQKDQ